MRYHPTPDSLRAMYDMLRTVSPFKGWRLPPGEEVEFHVVRRMDFQGEHDVINGQHRIRINSNFNRTVPGTIATMAHEMIHAYEHKLKIKAHHGPSWHRRADAICKALGFDRGTF